MYIASLDTRHFDFVAMGKTEKAARIALAEGWLIHCKTYDHVPFDPRTQFTGESFSGLCDPDVSLMVVIMYDDICIIQIHAGQCWRDRNDLMSPDLLKPKSQVQHD